MPVHRALITLFAVTAGAVASVSQADVFEFTDAAGNTHYTNVPNDPRYVRVLVDPETDKRSPAARGDWRARAQAYRELIDDAARAAAVHPALLRAVIAVESAFDAQAVSSKGAQGLMQLLPTTSVRYGVKAPFDPADNLRGGASYLHDLLQRYGNHIELALAAYNAGEDAVERYGRSIPPFAETRAYVPAVLKRYRQYLADDRALKYQKTLPPPT